MIGLRQDVVHFLDRALGLVGVDLGAAPIVLVGMRAEEILRLIDGHGVVVDVDDTVAKRRIEPQRSKILRIFRYVSQRRLATVAAGL
jgi:hypothetical protein